jgi:hypothetical protein
MTSRTSTFSDDRAVAAAVARARAAVEAAPVMVTVDDHGWDRPTPAGEAAERAVRRAGRAVAERAARNVESTGADLDRWPAARVRALAGAYRDALARVRSMGPPPEGVAVINGTEAEAALLAAALVNYPTDWITLSNGYAHRTDLGADSDPRALYLTSDPDRATYMSAAEITRTLPDGSRVTLQADVLYLRSVPRGWRRRGYAVACHEFAHRCEHTMPRIGQLTRVLAARRAIDPLTGGHAPVVDYLQDERVGPASADQVDWSDGEWVRPHGFVDRYMGKIYRNRQYHEVLSTGVEALFAGAYGGLAGARGHRADPEHRDFVLGVLSVV